MPLDRSLIGLLLLLGAVVAARFIMERALASLDAEKKLQLIDAMAPQRKYGLLVLVVILIVFYEKPWYLIGGAFAYFAFSNALSYRTMRKVSVPANYTRSFVIAGTISLAGLIGFLLLLLLPAPEAA